MRVLRWVAVVAVLLVGLPAVGQEAVFKVGFAKRDITPPAGIPMWGYGDRHDALATGTLDPLFAKCVVIDTGTEKLALVGLDLGRSPVPEMMESIKKQVRDEAGVTFVMMSGSHTHHGPVLELKNEDGKGRGKFDTALRYYQDLERELVGVIVDAAAKVEAAKIGWGSVDVTMNRNRHSDIEPKPRDPELAVLRFDDTTGRPIAVLVNFAAHPTNLDAADLRWSAEYPGQMMNAVEAEMGTNCLFMQGAAGDMSCNKTAETNTIETFGAAMADEVMKVAKDIETTRPETASIQGQYDEFTVETRLDFTNQFIVGMFRQAFFPELANGFMDWVGDNEFTCYLTTVMVNGQLALVGGSGEFFCQHSNRLKERSRADKTLFFGYCNGHNMYFPTIEAAAEGGYGADATVSWVELGTGERMMNTALINLYTMQGAYKSPLGGL